MAVSKGELQVKWNSTADEWTIDPVTNTTRTSEALSFSATAFAAQISCYVEDSSGTPADGDTVTFYIMYSTGDPDATGGDSFDDAMHAQKLCTLDVFNPSESEMQKTVPIIPGYKCKIYAVAAGGTAVYTIAAKVYEMKA